MPNICIPNAPMRTTKSQVENIFKKLNWGVIKRIRIYYKNTYNQIFIDFTVWNTNNPKTEDIRNKLLDGKTIRVIYNEPWFWKCYKNRFAP